MVLVAVLEELRDLFVGTDLAEDLAHVLDIYEALARPIVEGEHFLEADEAGLGQHSLLGLLLRSVDLNLVLHVKVYIVLLAPEVNSSDVMLCQIGVNFQQ